MYNIEKRLVKEQNDRNRKLLGDTPYTGEKFTSEVISFVLDPDNGKGITSAQAESLEALEIQSARIAIRALASLAEINELDHLGGALDLIPALVMTLAFTDYDKVMYTIENAHTSIGYYSALAAFGYLGEDDVVHRFRRSLDIAGHVSWVPGGTQLNGGRLGVMIPAAVGQALGLRANKGKYAWVLCHCGDAGWISGQALDGFNGADVHHAPITFIMHRNGIQLSGSNKQILDKDPRPVIRSLGIEIIEIESLFDHKILFAAYAKARSLAKEGRPSMIYPVGYTRGEDLNTFAERFGIADAVKVFAQKNNVRMDTGIWIPGSLMSYRDVEPMLECLFLVNDLPGGKGHHDGHMKGRDVNTVLSNPMLQLTPVLEKRLSILSAEKKRKVVSHARPPVGSENLLLDDKVVSEVKLPLPGKNVSARSGVEAGYALFARSFPEKMFVVSCDLDTSTKLEKARGFLKPDHCFEMSIEEQASALMANGLAMSSFSPQLNVFSTFAAFFEGIAREGFEMWRYQRNLNGVNEGLNVTFHLSHVGACTGRDHFSGWSLDWITLAMGYLPYLHRFYAPADARAAFIAVRDLAAHYGGHIIAIPRDNLPVLTKQGSEKPLWEAEDRWEPVTAFRKYTGAKKAILAFGAPAFLAGDAAERLNKESIPADVYIINGLPFENNRLEKILESYPGGLVTVEDGIIGTSDTGLRGFASLISGAAITGGIPVAHIGIVDPRIAPSEGYMEVWEHFGITVENLIMAVKNLG
jgi:transketolase N-terminal domain/subunit/transketolase C-terminal domain/subunit